MSSDPPGQRRPPAEIPSDMRAFNRKAIEEFRANGGQFSGFLAGRQLLLLTTTGARTGEPRTVILGYGKEGDRYVVVASANGAPDHPTWYRNLQKRAEVTVEVGPEKKRAQARTATRDERERLGPLVPYLKTEQEKTDREIPLVILEPIQG